MISEKEQVGKAVASIAGPVSRDPVANHGGDVLVYAPGDNEKETLQEILDKENLDSLHLCSSLIDVHNKAAKMGRLDLVIIPFSVDDEDLVEFTESLFLNHPFAMVIGIASLLELETSASQALTMGFHGLLQQSLAEAPEQIRRALTRSRTLYQVVRSLPFVNKLREEKNILDRDLEETRSALCAQARRFEESQEVFYLDLSRMMSIIDTIVDGIIFTDRDACITLLNPVAERLLLVNSFLAIGKQAVELEGREDLVRVIAEDQEKALEQDTVSRTVEVNLESQDVLYLKITTTAVMDYRGNFTGLLSVIQDVTTEFKADELKNQYLSIVSHELRTPLTGIKSFLSMMVQGTLGPINEQQERVLETVQESTLRLECQIDKLISLGMFEQNEFAQDYEVFPLADIVKQAMAPFETEAENRGITLRSSMPAAIDDVMLQADKENIKRVLQILLENAVKFNRREGKVLLDVISGDDEILFRVEDTGIGIEPRYKKRIFEKFFQVEAPLTRQYGGAGLGLTVAKRILRSHDSEIQLDSVVGQGSTFQFSLKRYRVALDEEANGLTGTGNEDSRERSE